MDCAKCKNAKAAASNKYCKDCHKEYQREWRATEKGKASCKKTKKKTRSKATRFIARLLLRSKCKLCGNNDPMVLQFDHIDRNDKSDEIGKLMRVKGSGLGKLKNEIRKCRILCANCHMKHTAKQLNTWRYQIFSNSAEILDL